jgi:secreted Zn-dependent insulinase-like peptidase
LTEEGLGELLYAGAAPAASEFAIYPESFEEIVVALFQYLNLLKRELPQEWIFQEVSPFAC